MTAPGPRNPIDLERLRTDPAYELARVCVIREEDLDEGLRTQASLYAYASALYVKARAEAQDASYEHEKAAARAFSALREDGVAIGQAKEQAELDPEVQEARKRAMEAETRSRMFNALCKGLEQRRDMLIQLSARQREDMRNQL